jgi:hypothetical protein
MTLADSTVAQRHNSRKGGGLQHPYIEFQDDSLHNERLARDLGRKRVGQAAQAVERGVMLLQMP